ncbi:hypothetical protein MNBD_GAMMA10-530, partial [hydrothermal vent metagenome]
MYKSCSTNKQYSNDKSPDGPGLLDRLPGVFVCAVFLWAGSFSCNASAPVSLALSSATQSVPLIVERSVEKFMHES